MSNANKLGAAFHEAGHAIVAWFLGVRVAKIVVGIDDDESKGGADIADAAHLDLIDQLAIALGGVEAQALFNAPTHDLTGMHDFARVAELINEDETSEKRSEGLRRQGYVRARDILSRNADWVTLLATRLCDAGVVNEEEFLRIMNDPSDSRQGSAALRHRL